MKALGLKNCAADKTPEGVARFVWGSNKACGTHPGIKIIFEGDPTNKSGFVHIRIGENSYEVRPADVYMAIQRVRSDGLSPLGE